MDGDNRAVHSAGKVGLERFKSDIRLTLYNVVQFCQKCSVEGRPASPAMASGCNGPLGAASLQETTNPSRRNFKCLCGLFPCCTAGIGGIQHPLS